MAFPAGSSGLVPWMNGRVDAGAGNELSDATCVSFPYGGNVVFKWIEDGTYPGIEIAIWAHGRWGTDRQYSDHYAIAKARTTPPAAPTYTVANRTALFAIASPVQDQTALVTSDNSYWIFYGLSWIRLVQKVNAGTITAYAVTATIYTITVPQTDIPEIDEMLIEPGGYYDLCWEKNNGHAKRYDATFNVLPVGYKIYDEIPDRTELNSRVAGEKALFEDEFVTASQIEAGTGITIKWRKIDGTLAGYTTDPSKGGNLVLESSGAMYTQAAKANAGVYYDEQTTYLQFRDKSFIHPFPDDSKIPIEFDVYKENGVSVVTGNAINNNLYALKKDVLNVVSYPLGAYGDQTVNYIQFNDTADVSWTVTGNRTTIQTAEGLVDKKGINVSAVITFPTGYSGWNITDGDMPSPTVGFVSDNDTVTFDGTNGVSVQVSTLSATDHKVEINRPLQIQDDGANVGNAATTTINFDSNGSTSTAYPVNFAVVDTGSGQRRIRAYSQQPTTTSVSDVWVKHWWRDGVATDIQATFATATQVVVGGFNVNGGVMNFSGHGFWDTNQVPDLFLGTSELVTEHSGIVEPPQTPAVYESPFTTFVPPFPAQDRYLFEPVRILKDGTYLIHTVVQGLSSINPTYCRNGVPLNNHELSLHYIVDRVINGFNVAYSTYCLDHKTESHFATDNENNINFPTRVSKKWSLKATAILSLKVGDALFGRIGAISYVPSPIVAPNFGVQRDYTVNYITQHIELVSEKTLTTDLIPIQNYKLMEFFDFTRP